MNPTQAPREERGLRWGRSGVATSRGARRVACGTKRGHRPPPASVEKGGLATHLPETSLGKRGLSWRMTWAPLGGRDLGGRVPSPSLGAGGPVSRVPSTSFARGGLVWRVPSTSLARGGLGSRFPSTSLERCAREAPVTSVGSSNAASASEWSAQRGASGRRCRFVRASEGRPGRRQPVRSTRRQPATTSVRSRRRGPDQPAPAGPPRATSTPGPSWASGSRGRG